MSQVIQLDFEPKGSGHNGDDGNMASRAEICVSCGAAEGLHRTYVVC